MKKDLYCTTSNDGETQFSISILETGWISDVFLILTDKIKSKYEEGEFTKIKVEYEDKEIINGKTYSIFSTYHRFLSPSPFMVAFFIFTIHDVTYVTDHMYFSVED